MQNTFEDEEDFEPSIPWGLVARLFILLFSFAWIGPLTNTAEFSLGMQASTGNILVRYGLKFAFYFATIYVVLLWPIAQFVMTQLRETKGPWMRLLVLTLLVSPPILAYGHYIGEIKVMMDVRDLFLSVVVPVLLGALFYEKTEKLWLFALVVSLPTFLSFAVFDDLLGPFQVLVYYSTKSPTFYFWRALTPLLALATGLGSLTELFAGVRKPVRVLPLTADQEC